MSQSVEWVNAGNTYGHPSIVDDDFTDAYGTGVSPGNIGVWCGEGVLIEGTRQELLDFFYAGVNAVSNAPHPDDAEEWVTIAEFGPELAVTDPSGHDCEVS